MYDAMKDKQQIREMEMRLEAVVRQGIASKNTFRTKNRIELDEGMVDLLGPETEYKFFGVGLW